MLSYYVIDYEMFRKVMKRTEKVVLIDHHGETISGGHVILQYEKLWQIATL